MAVTTNTWLGASSGQLPKAAQINQFLGVHALKNLYAGTAEAAELVNGSAHTSGSATIYMAQSFPTFAAQTTVGYVSVPITSFTSSGSLLGTTTLSLYASSGSAPTGSPLVSTTLTTEYAYAASSSGVDTTSVIYPLPITGLTASGSYWLVLAPAGNNTQHYTWRQSNQTSGASLSTNGGVSWTAQAYGFQYQIYDQTASGLLTATWEDSGARWSALTYTATEEISTIAEYTVGQSATGYTQGYRTLTYTNGLIAKVA
jgi:hypothetical protein